MKDEKYLNSVDWDFYIERAGAIFSPSSSVNAYSKLLERAIGTGFKHQLYYFTGNSCIYYRSATEMDKVLHILADIADQDPDKLRFFVAKEKDMQEKYRQLGNIKNHKDLFAAYDEIFLYNTIIPYLVMGAEKYMQKDNRELCEAFGKIRETSFYQLMLNEHIRPRYFDEVVKKLDISKEEAESLSMLEVYKIIDGQDINVDKQEIAKRQKPHYVYWDDEQKDVLFYFGEIDNLKQSNYSDVKEFKGTPTHPGKIKAKVSIINLVEEMDKFEEGDVLVTINSNPALMPVIKKASAIVSDEGGMNCHASIVSREFKIPGIVGTKMATKVLKDGDVVEVDAEQGIVRKL